MMNPRFMLTLIVMFTASATILPAQPRPPKKMIEFGWDVPTPEFIRKNIVRMEQRPFDGIIFRLPEDNHAFDTRPWKEADFQPQRRALAAIQWRKFSDNFLILYAANRWGMDWDDDAQWEVIARNMKLFMGAVQAGRCLGVCFDPEPYGENPWAYPGKFRDKTFGQACDRVRQRGRQFIQVLQASKPDLKVITFFQLSVFSAFTRQTDEQKRQAALAPEHYALWLPFFLGMLEGAGPGVTFIDGNEPSYYYESSESYYRAYHLMRQEAQTLVPIALRTKYNAQVRAGAALYIDTMLAIRDHPKILSRFLTPPERLQLLEHNAYYALTTTDEYVWCYGEKMNWWGTETRASPGGKIVVPDGLEQGLIAARQKVEQGKPLGHDIRKMVEAAHVRQKENAK